MPLDTVCKVYIRFLVPLKRNLAVQLEDSLLMHAVAGQTLMMFKIKRKGYNVDVREGVLMKQNVYIEQQGCIYI